MSVVATAASASWVVPEILTAQPAQGATLSAPTPTPATGAGTGPGSGSGSGTGVSTSPSTTGGAQSQPTTSPTAHESAQGVPATSGALANTGDGLERDIEVGLALVAGGWVLKRWVSRQQSSPKQDPAGGTP
jgi:hypothetical protein